MSSNAEVGLLAAILTVVMLIGCNSVTAQESDKSWMNKGDKGLSYGMIYPSAPCMGGLQFGANAGGMGFGFGKHQLDHECGIRETARVFELFGYHFDALQVLCSSRYASVASACKDMIAAGMAKEYVPSDEEDSKKESKAPVTPVTRSGHP